MQVNRKYIPPTAMMLRDPAHSNWPAHSNQVKEMLGLNPKAKLPVRGTGAKVIQGICVWVRSLEDAKRAKQFHRVRCLCPYCKADIPAGRLHQHITIHVGEK